MASPNVEAAERIYAARLRGDLDALVAELDPDVEWRPHLSALGGDVVRGQDGVRSYLVSLDDEWDDFRQEVEQSFDAGDRVVVFLNTHGRGRASGVELHLQVAHVLCFRDGKCVENQTYIDREEALTAAGLRRR